MAIEIVDFPIKNGDFPLHTIQLNGGIPTSPFPWWPGEDPKALERPVVILQGLSNLGPEYAKGMFPEYLLYRYLLL